MSRASELSRLKTLTYLYSLDAAHVAHLVHVGFVSMLVDAQWQWLLADRALRHLIAESALQIRGYVQDRFVLMQ